MNTPQTHFTVSKPAPAVFKQYDSLSNSTRQMLVKLVFDSNMSVRKASKMLQLNYTSAKALV
jgi:hypothetical protein